MVRSFLLNILPKGLVWTCCFLVIISLLGCSDPAEMRNQGAAALPTLAVETADVLVAPTMGITHPTVAITATVVVAPPENLRPTPTLRLEPTPLPPPETPTSIPIMPANTPAPIIQGASSFPRAVDPAEIESILAGLSLEEKVGQMIMVGMPGSTLDSETRDRIINEGLGGVIFLEHNAPSAQQVSALTTAIQEAALYEGPGIPLFIAWNHEGGRVVRRGSGMTRFQSNMAVGAAGQRELPFAIGQAVGQEMKSLGVNMNYAPVLDVNTAPANPVIGLRAFSDNSELVSALGERYIAGLQSTGIMGVAKHFPGHGGVDVDSHVGLPLLEKTAELLWQTELIPFRTAIDANIGAIMVAHMQIPAIDPAGWPSSLSIPIVQGLLREQLGYTGVIMTDDLGMGALNGYTPQIKAVQAVLAGNDVLLTVNTAAFDLYRAAILEAVRSGQIPETRIDESVRRILQLKLAYDQAVLRDGPLLPDQDKHEQLLRESGAAAVELTRDSLSWLPLTLPNNRLLLISPDKLNAGSAAGDGVSLLGEYLRGQGVEVTELIYTYNNPGHISQVQNTALSLINNVDAAVVVTWDAILRHHHFGETAQETMVNNLLSTGKPVIAVAGSLPYDSQRLSTAPALLKMYGDTPGQVAGLVSYLTGWK